MDFEQQHTEEVMKTKVILYMDESKMIYDSTGTFIGTANAEPEFYEENRSSHEMVLMLVKQGVKPDELIKMRNADLI